MSERKWFPFHVRRSTNTRVTTEGELLGWGIKFPEGGCYVAWKRDVFAPEDRLEHPHVSVYGSVEDVEQGTGGTVDPLTDLPVGVDE
jgi:hypothetical protein